MRPKALCPVNGVPLVDLAIERVRSVTDAVAVNLHHGREALAAHLEDRVHLSIEVDEALGTAGAIGRLRPWIDGRAVLAVNADVWTPAGVAALLEGWDGERLRVLVPGGGPFSHRSLIAGALLPWSAAARLAAEPAGLYEAVWAPAGGAVEVVGLDAPFVDCGTPAAYLTANLAASGGRSVVAPSARVLGEVVRSVVWEDTVVAAGERLVDAIRVNERMTVLVR